MDANSKSLFRAEALRHRTERLHGAVVLTTPLAWQAIGFLLLVALLVTVGFFSTASYARVETVPGSVTLDKGVATIIPSRAGIVSTLSVTEGQRVRAGDMLVRIRSEEDMVGGDTAPARILRSLGEQDAHLAAQGGLLLSAAGAEQARLHEQITGLSGELSSLQSQIADQRRLVQVAEADWEGIQGVAANGFISRRDMEAREAVVLSRRQQLAQLQQASTAKMAAIAEAHRATVQSNAAARAQLAGSQSDRAALLQRLAEVDLARGYAITSPVNGVVTALTARPGQPASPQQQLMMVVPANAKPRVELYVPTAAAGFLRPGQDVRVAVDAFPYQQFGTLRARLLEISAATVAKQGPSGPVSVYLVIAELPEPYIRAYGRKQRLAPGMTLTARIVTESRSLLQWLFQPVIAVGNR